MGHLHFGKGGKVKQGTPDAWLPVAAQIARYARRFAERNDIVANVGPAVGGPFATACWSPYMADLDVNVDTCLPGYSPERVDLDDEVFQLGAQPFMGAITHEAAHARWTCWTPYDLGLRRKSGAEPWTQATMEIVIALEESRIERLAVMADRTKRAALAQCALGIVLRDFKVNNTLFGASLSLALTVGRYAILSTEEVDRFRAIIEPHLPLGLMGKLEKLIREYHAMPVIQAKDGHYPDSYFQKMFDIADRWLIAIRETAAEVEAAERKARERREAEERAAQEKAEREAAERAEAADEEPAEDETDVDAAGPEGGDEDAEPGEGGEDDEAGDGAGDESDDAGEGEPVETGETDDETEGEAAPEEGSGSPESTGSGARGEDSDEHADAEGAEAAESGEPGEAVEAERGDTDVERYEAPGSGEEAAGDDEGDLDGDSDDEPADAAEEAPEGVEGEGEPVPAEPSFEDPEDVDESRGEGHDTSDVEHHYDEDPTDEEVEDDEPARDVSQPQPDLRSGIPGEDVEGEAVVVIVFEDAPETEAEAEAAEAPEDEDAPEDAPEDEDEPEDDPLGDAIKDAAGAAAMDREADALDERREKVSKRMVEDRREDAKRRNESARVMDSQHGEGKHGFSTFCDSHRMAKRAPEGGERVAANRLAAMLERITFHDRAVKKVDRVLPGGKLRPRAAVARAADRDRGGRAEIPVWRAKERKHTDETPITVGIMTDVSGSMGRNSEPSAVLTYVLSNAVSRIDGKVATAVFGTRGYLVNRAHERATEVQPWRASDGTEAFREGALLIDAELRLLDGDGARILVVFSDAHLVNDDDAEYARTFMRLCKQKNVAVVWCTYGREPINNFGHGALLELSGTAADIANTLGAAITTEVQKIEASRGA